MTATGSWATSCSELGTCATEPLIAIGVLSAAAYACRRLAIRSTWGNYPEVLGGEVLLRFITSIAPAPSEALLAEQSKHVDIVMLQTNVTSRNIGPMLTVFGWLQHAATTPPYSRASFVAKLDDDGFVWVPEMARHLRLMRAKPYVYYGIFYWTVWQYGKYRTGGSSYTSQQVTSGNQQCIKSGNCSSAFPFAAAPVQIVSLDLARVLGSSSRAVAYTESSRAILEDEVKSKTFATEDAFLGFALNDLLPADFGGITLAMIDRYQYTYDDWGSNMKPTTTFYHDKAKSRTRMRANYLYTFEKSCPTNVSIRCGGRSESRRFAETCTLHPHNRTCRIKQTHMKNSPFWLCTAFSEQEIRAGRARKYSANLTAEVCAKYREEEWVERERQRGLDALVSVWYVLLS